MKHSTSIIITVLSIVSLCTVSCHGGWRKAGKEITDLHTVGMNLLEECDGDPEYIEERINWSLDDVESYLIRADIERVKEDYSSALSYLDKALKVNRPRISGYPNSSILWWKASIYDEMGESGEACSLYGKALELALKDNKECVPDIQWDYAQSLYEEDRYEESDEVYKALLQRDEADVAPMVGLARNMLSRGQYQNVIELMTKAVSFDKDYSEPYKFLALAYNKLDETDLAIDNAIMWLSRDWDVDSEGLVGLFLEHDSYAIVKIKEELGGNGENPALRFLLLALYEQTGEYGKALEEYDAIEDYFGDDEMIFSRRAACYSELGMTSRALEEIDRALAISPDAENWNCKGDIYFVEGQYVKALACYDRAIEVMPSEASSYVSRGRCLEWLGDEDGALKDYNLGIDMDGSSPLAHLYRGRIHLGKGKLDSAMKDFGKVLELDEVPECGSCCQFVFFLTGRFDEAQRWMDRIIADNPKAWGSWYDQACLHALMGNEEGAITALRKALELGFSHFSLMKDEPSFESIRDREDFRELMDEFQLMRNDRIERFERLAAVKKRSGPQRMTRI